MWQKYIPSNLATILLTALYSVATNTWALEAGSELTLVRQAGLAAGMAATYIADHLGDSGPEYGPQQSTTAYAFLAVFSAITAACCWYDAHFLRVTVTFVALAAFYDTPVPFTKLRIKALFPCSKTIFVPAMHVGWCWSLTSSACDPAPFAGMFVYYVLVNVGMDIKDIADDRAKGVVTVPTILGADGTICCIVAASLCVAAATAAYSPAQAITTALLGLHAWPYHKTGVPPNTIVFYYALYRVLGFYAARAAL